MRKEGYEIVWVKESMSGMSDEDIITLAKLGKQVLITEDKDFGEWVFAHQVSGLTIIFLRYDKEDYNTILLFLRSALKTIEAGGKHEFITINKNKVRRREV